MGDREERVRRAAVACKVCVRCVVVAAAAAAAAAAADNNDDISSNNNNTNNADPQQNKPCMVAPSHLQAECASRQQQIDEELQTAGVRF